jgi:hypothetical protein
MGERPGRSMQRQASAIGVLTLKRELHAGWNRLLGMRAVPSTLFGAPQRAYGWRDRWIKGRHGQTGILWKGMKFPTTRIWLLAAVANWQPHGRQVRMTPCRHTWPGSMLVLAKRCLKSSNRNHFKLTFGQEYPGKTRQVRCIELRGASTSLSRFFAQGAWE